MKERPILFSAPMVQAILDGRKTQTRRIVRIPEIVRSEGLDNGLTTIEWLDKHESGPGFYAWMTEYPDEGSASVKCPYGIPGDRLWVREAFGFTLRNRKPYVYYKIDPDNLIPVGTIHPYKEFKGYPSIHMAKWLCRITLEITEVRVQRLQEISEEDAKAEGCRLTISFHLSRSFTAREQFRELWESINGAGSWAANPWVWCVSFKKVEQ